MISQTAGGLLYAARIKLKLTSLDGIAKLTGLDKRTIRRYETGELAIPKNQENVLAEAYFANERTRREFMEKCRNERQSEKESIKHRRKRRHERSVVGRSFEVRFRIGYQQSTEYVPTKTKKKIQFEDQHDALEDALIAQINEAFKDELSTTKLQSLFYKARQKYAGVSLRIFVLERRNGRAVCEVDEKGIRYFPASEDAFSRNVEGNEAINALITFSHRRKIGTFALLDLAEEELKKLDMFRKHKSKDNDTILLDKSTIAELIALLAQHDKTKQSLRGQVLDTAKMILQYIHSRFDDAPVAKAKLLRVIQKGKSTIAQKLHASVS